jgi:glutathione S-transferase
MKLYDAPVAPNPRRVRWLMAEKGIGDIEIVPVSIPDGEHKQASYLAKAGLPQLPMLDMDDGTAITESLAICRYLESRYPEPNLFGRDPVEVAEIEMWTRRGELMVAHPMMIGVRHTHPAMGALEQQNTAVGEYNRDASLKALKFFNRRLEGRDWIAADRLTIADIIAFVGLDFGRMIKVRPPEDLPNVVRWHAAMSARPAAAAGMPARAG